jgi:hypothetical protein
VAKLFNMLDTITTWYMDWEICSRLLFYIQMRNLFLGAAETNLFYQTQLC